jgi:hypothetical protein
MKYKRDTDRLDKYRPGAHALMGDFFIIPESPSGSIFLNLGEMS